MGQNNKTVGVSSSIMFCHLLYYLSFLAFVYMHSFGRVARGYLTDGYVKPQSGTSKRTAAGAVDKQKRWHTLVSQGLQEVLEHNTQVVGAEKAKAMQPYTVMNTDEANIMATGSNWKIVGSRDRKKHDNQNNSSRASITLLRTGCPAPEPVDSSGPTFILLAGNNSDKVDTIYTPSFLVRTDMHGMLCVC